jgi:glycosyltransferase involved in cell wall biosynthesis
MTRAKRSFASMRRAAFTSEDTSTSPIGDLGRPAREITPRLGRRRIGIELRHVARGSSGGIVVLLIGVLEQLFNRRPATDFTVFCTAYNRELITTNAPNVDVITLPLDRYFVELTRLTHKAEIDALFRSYPTAETVGFPLNRQIFLVPDVQHEYHPEFFDEETLKDRRKAFKQVLEGAGGVATISEYARGTIQERVVGKGEVFITSPGLPTQFLEASSLEVSSEELALIPDGDFFYFPANLWPHKNHERLFEALRRFRSRTGRDVSLVLTGFSQGWDEMKARHVDLPIVHLGYVSPALMRVLYKHAVALVFFSLYEGFGIPLLEAYHFDTPVVCSNTTSLPEVAGSAALTCDPTDVDAIALQLARIVEDEELRARLVRLGKERLDAYSWEAAADQLAEGIERVIERAAPALSGRPLVSIVTPSFNQGRFIHRTIESVLSQSYPNIEYLVIDGGSTDETLDILKSYGDRVRWISEPDSGQSAAINKGMRRARGVILGYLNSDDVLLPHAIETVVSYLQKHPVCDLVYGDAAYIDEDDRVIGSYPTASYSFDRLMDDCCICQPAAYWRATLADAVGPFDEARQFAMDYDYWLRVDRSGFVLRHLPVTIAQSRLHAGAKTLSARRAIYGEIFSICRAQGGYVSRNYVEGFWDHVARETIGPMHVLAKRRMLRRTLEEMHHLWLNRLAYARREALSEPRRRARRMLARRLRQSPRLFALLLWIIKRQRPTQVRVSGCWADNWIEERLEVALDASRTNQRLFLIGRPVEAMEVELAVDGAVVARHQLVADRVQAIPVNLPAGPEARLSVSFSRSLVDDLGRPLSLFLEETNLFREEDLPPLAWLTPA